MPGAAQRRRKALAAEDRNAAEDAFALFELRFFERGEELSEAETSRPGEVSPVVVSPWRRLVAWLRRFAGDDRRPWQSDSP